MKIATWNVNSINARLENVTAWLKQAEPDVACLQEIKTVDDAFPSSAFEDLGYNVAVHGQKSYNGVAILSKHPFDEVIRRLPGNDGDDHARYVEAVVPWNGIVVRVASIYLPNGNPVGTDKFAYKIAWMDRLIDHAAGLLALEEPFALAGDFNVIPVAEDARNPDAWLGDALFQPQTRDRYRRLINLGLTDGFRACHAGSGSYTFWDYQAGAWQKDNGIRIDHLLLSPQAADRLATSAIDRHVRAWERPSDHVPVWIELEI